MRTLVLNAGYEPIHLVSWEKGLCLVLLGKAEIIAEHDGVARSINDEFIKPSVVRLVKYVYLVKRICAVRCTRKNILTRDKYRCQYCGTKVNSKKITIDHVIPKSKGGTHVWNNVVACCQECNSRKGDKLLKNTSMKLLNKPKQPAFKDFIDGIHSEYQRLLPHIFK